VEGGFRIARQPWARASTTSLGGVTVVGVMFCSVTWSVGDHSMVHAWPGYPRNRWANEAAVDSMGYHRQNEIFCYGFFTGLWSDSIALYLCFFFGARYRKRRDVDRRSGRAGRLADCRSVGRDSVAGGKANLRYDVRSLVVRLVLKNGFVLNGGTITLGTSSHWLLVLCSSDLRTRWPKPTRERFALGNDAVRIALKQIRL